MRVLCCGDRNWTSYEIIRRELEKLRPDTFIIEGCANGVDSISGDVATQLGYIVLEFPADWKKYGRAAGPIRNKQMLDEGKPDLVLAFHTDIENSKGTKNMIEQSMKRKIRVVLIKE
jgi:hypothetical protein